MKCRLRQADFVELIEAAAPALGWAEGVFTEVYADNAATAVRAVIEDSPFASAVREFAEECVEWDGSASELLPLIDSRVSESIRKHRSFPKTPEAVGSALKRFAAALRTVGVDLRFDRVGQKRKRTWTIHYKPGT